MGVRIRKKDGDWYVFINWRRKRKSKCVGKSREAAEQVRREIEKRLALGSFSLDPEAEVPSFREYADSWLKHHADQQLKPSTSSFYREFLRRYVLPPFGQLRLDEIRRQAIKNWMGELAARGLSRNTVRLAISSLRVVLNAAIEDEFLESNPAQKLGRLVKTQKLEREASALTSEEAARFLDTAKEHCSEHYPLFLTALRAGLREGELVALRWGDIQFGESEDVRNRYILVQRNFDRRSRKFLTPKSRKPRRVDLSRELRRVLVDLRDQRLLEAFTRGQKAITDDLVFQSDGGSILDAGNLVRRHFLPLLERAGLRRIRFHDLRHTFGSLLIQAGAPHLRS